jgi:DNA-binding transcriptional regulator GbsR (MarR family)
MPNIPDKLAAERKRFIEEMAGLLMPWGVPQTAARLYGYLLLNPDPVSLDRITSDLEISKSSASVAARLLESYMLARRRSERGTKRALYEASDNYERMLTEQNRLFDAMAQLLRGNVDTAGARAGERLQEMADFYRVIREAMDVALNQWRGRNSA